MDFLLNLPARDSCNFCSCGPASTSFKEEQPRMKTYQATHDRTDAPANQVITTESTSILVREFERSARKLAGAGRWKRAAGQGVQQSRATKYPRRSCIFEGLVKTVKFLGIKKPDTEVVSWALFGEFATPPQSQL